MTDLNVEDNGMEMNFDIELEVEEVVEGGGGGVTDYRELSNLPKIENVTLIGNKTLDDLNIQEKGDYLTEIPPEYVTEEEFPGLIPTETIDIDFSNFFK